MEAYSNNLSHNLSLLNVPSAVFCCDSKCVSDVHHNEISAYAASEAISAACLTAADSSLPHTSGRDGKGRIPGWSERVAPLREKSLFWHHMWVDCERPRSGVVADCMRRTRAAYHNAIRQVRKDEEAVVRERVAEALLSDPSRSFWDEVKKIRNNKTGFSKIVDGCTDESSISQVFATKYKQLYNSVPFDNDELEIIRNDIDASLSNSCIDSDTIITCHEVQAAIAKLKAHKSDGNIGLSSDHFIHAGNDLSVHIAILFTSLIIHGSVPAEFLVSTIIPIPKNRHASAADSDNFRGIALSSVYCKLFDYAILCKYNERLISSDLQFGFKQNSSTSMCSMVLKETISYYVKNNTPVSVSYTHLTLPTIYSV